MQYTETELKALISTVEKEFTAHLRKTEEAVQADLSKSEVADGSAAPLVKAEEKPAEKKDAKPFPKEGEAKPEAKEGEQKPESKEAAPAPKEGEAPAPKEGDAKAGHDESVPHDEAAEQEGAGHGYDDEDMDHMRKMYASMSKSERKAHHDVIMGLAKEEMSKCGDMSMGKSEIKDENPVLNSKPTDKGSDTNTAYNENSGGAIAGSEPKNSPGAKSPASKAEGMQMSKSETNEVELLKSELAAEKAKATELKKNFDGVQEFLAKLVKKVPQGKAITSMEQIAKSEGAEQTQELSKSEVNQILLKKSSDPNLSKSDREAINAFYLSKADINTISHLLKN